MPRDDELVRALESLRARRAAIDDAIGSLQRVIDAESGQAIFRAATAGTKIKRAGSTSRSHGPAAGVAGVARVLREQPGRGFTPTELAEAMIANGWNAPEDATRAARAAANRLRDQADSRVSLEDGKFVYRPSDDSPDAADEQ